MTDEGFERAATPSSSANESGRPSPATIKTKKEKKGQKDKK